MKEMYKGIANSPETKITKDISSTDVNISVADISVFPEAPNLAVIGIDAQAETIKYEGINGSILVGCTRGYQGGARPWIKDSIIARNFTEADHRALIENVEELEKNKASNKSVTELETKVNKLNVDKVEKVEGKGLSPEEYTKTEKDKVAKVPENFTIWEQGMEDGFNQAISEKVGKEELADVSFSGHYDDLENKPDLTLKVDISKINNSFDEIMLETNIDNLNNQVAAIKVIKEIMDNIPAPELATALKDGLLSKELFNKLNDLQLATTIKDGLLSKEMFEKLENFEGVQGVSNANLNNLIMTGFYTVSNANNIPEGFNGTGGVLVYRFAKGAPELFGTIQMYVDFNGRVAIRAAQGESDNNWKEIGGRSKSSIIGLAGYAIYATTNDNTANLNTGTNMVKLETISTLQLPLEIIPSNSAFGYGWNITKNMPCIIKILNNAKVSVTTIGGTNSSQDDICFSMTYVL